MNVIQVEKHLLSLPESWIDYPFGPESKVFKIVNKLFAIIGQNKGVWRVNVKCDPEEALALRDIFPAVIPGYHMNKKHWNTVVLDGTVPAKELIRMMDRSYALVVKSLKATDRQVLEDKHGALTRYK